MKIHRLCFVLMNSLFLSLVSVWLTQLSRTRFLWLGYTGAASYLFLPLLLQLDDQDCAATQSGDGLRGLFAGGSIQRHPPVSAPVLASFTKHPH